MQHFNELSEHFFEAYDQQVQWLGPVHPAGGRAQNLDELLAAACEAADQRLAVAECTWCDSPLFFSSDLALGDRIKVCPCCALLKAAFHTLHRVDENLLDQHVRNGAHCLYYAPQHRNFLRLDVLRRTVGKLPRPRTVAPVYHRLSWQLRARRNPPPGKPHFRCSSKNKMPPPPSVLDDFGLDLAIFDDADVHDADLS